MGTHTTGSHADSGRYSWRHSRVADQTSDLKSGGRPAESGAQALVALLVDGLKLADLQLQLLTLDATEFWGRARKSMLVAAIGIAALIAALPVAMFGGAEYLRQTCSWSIEFALLLVSGIVILSAALGIGWSVRRLESASQPLRRSAEEMQANLRWIRSILHDDSAQG